MSLYTLAVAQYELNAMSDLIFSICWTVSETQARKTQPQGWIIVTLAYGLELVFGNVVSHKLTVKVTFTTFIYVQPPLSITVECQ